MSENRKQRKIQEKKPTLNEDQILPSEKWLVAFKNPNSKKPEAFVFVRQFYAPGFYEAYDMVATYAEKLKLHILWFKEKRNCGYTYINRNYPQLESFCTYCNNKFNHIDPIPCTKEDCHAEFCSKECVIDHYKMRHKN